ncbi:MAG TPA: hypothetical protein VE422_25235 [Terriglobia bacterium]|nr:hypothetical protein [Terriglobia bacterium]
MVPSVFSQEIPIGDRDLGIGVHGTHDHCVRLAYAPPHIDRPKLNQVLDALAHDFRRWLRHRDYRKCDVLGIANDGLNAELLEVTTVDNAASAILQVNSKLAILRETVNRIHNISVDWRPSRWRPEPGQMFRMLESGARRVRYV